MVKSPTMRERDNLEKHTTCPQVASIAQSRGLMQIMSERVIVISATGTASIIYKSRLSLGSVLAFAGLWLG
jgi:hypothetical protein